MAAKPGKASMIMKLKFLSISILILFCSYCKRNTVTETIPTGPVSLTIDLNLPSNSHLTTVGNFSFYSGGIKGVLVVHDYDDNWYAFERTCAFEPLKDCSTIWVDTLNLQYRCGNYQSGKFSSCCNSRYIFNGYPINGPAKGRLAQYKIQKNSNLLYVYN